MHWEQFQLARGSAALEGKADQGSKMVLFVLISHADPKTAIAFPGRELLAEECCMTEKGVQQIIDKLIERGFISLVKGGVGRKNLKHYLCHAEQGISMEKLAEKENTVPLLLDEKGERGAPFIPGNTREKENGVPIKGERGSNLNNVKGERGSTHIRNEDKNKDIKSSYEENEQEREIPVGVHSQSSRSILAIHLPLAEAISGVCGMRFKSLNPYQFSQMKKSLDTILEESPEIDLEELPTEVEFRFTPPIFNLSNLPHLHQVGEWWVRQGVQKEHYDKTQKPKEISEFAELYNQF